MALNDNRGQRDNRLLLVRCIKLLEYLSRHTEKGHGINQTDLRNDPDIELFLGSGETLHNTLSDLTEALNLDLAQAPSGGEMKFKPADEWRLVYKAFSDFYGDPEKAPQAMSPYIKDIYFNHLFSHGEMDLITDTLRTSKLLNKEQADSLTAKLLTLMSKHYSKPSYELDFREYTDIPQLCENVSIIQRAISMGRKISFTKNYYNSNKILVPTRTRRHSVSPHYIVCDNGRLFLCGGFDNDVFCVYRIDLLSDIHISSKGARPIPSSDKSQIRGLPAAMTEDFKTRHLNSSYEMPVLVEFEWTCYVGKSKNELDCTALYSAFGRNFDIDENGTVTLWTSEFGMLDFAMRYSEYVTVKKPDTLCRKIAKRVQVLQSKYNKYL